MGRAPSHEPLLGAFDVAASERERPWFVYLVECCGGRVYVGVTPDLVERMRKHRAGTGARFTTAHPPEFLLGAMRYPSRSVAQSVEYEIRQQPAMSKRLQAQEWVRQAAQEHDPAVIAVRGAPREPLLAKLRLAQQQIAEEPSTAIELVVIEEATRSRTQRTVSGSRPRVRGEPQEP